jgi:5,10-methylenetetrahydromethanopterin reductase
VLFTFSNLPAVGWKLPVADIVSLARRCEEVGFDRFGVADLQFHYDVVAVMTACLTATRRLGVESLVTNVYTRDPSLLACAWAAMADLSGGRAIFGIGAGVERPKRVHVAPWGHERPHAVDAVREGIEVVRRMWRGERVTLDGRVVHVHDAALDCPLPPAIPVLVAARGPRMLELAGTVADIVHVASLFLAAEHRAEDIAHVFRGAARAGRARGSFEVDVSVTVSASRDRERARRRALRNAAQTILWTAGSDPYARRGKPTPPGFDVPSEVVDALRREWDMWKDSDLPAHLGARISDDILDRFTVWGEPRECAARLVEMGASLPAATGFRIKFPLPVRSASFAEYAEEVDALGEVLAAYREAERAPAAPILARS